MLRRLYPEQPESFAFTPANQAWAEAEMTKYPERRQASAVIALMWRAQEQEGWLTRPAIEYVAEMLGMDFIRALEVATFYFMYQLHPVGSVAHFQICGTTPCMLCGAEDLVAVCREKIAREPYELSSDGRFSWEEVECLGACANAPMAQIGKDYYEDLTPEGFADLIDRLAAGEVPVPGSQAGRFSSEPKSGLTSLTAHAADRMPQNDSVSRAVAHKDTIKRIDGSEVALSTPWRDKGANHDPAPSSVVLNEEPVEISVGQKASAPASTPEQETAPEAEARPALLDGPRGGSADDLKKIKGVGPKLEAACNVCGIYHFDQIAGWTEAEIVWADNNIDGAKGRVTSDDWVGQAKDLVKSREA